MVDTRASLERQGARPVDDAEFADYLGLVVGDLKRIYEPIVHRSDAPRDADGWIIPDSWKYKLRNEVPLSREDILPKEADWRGVFY